MEVSLWPTLGPQVDFLANIERKEGCAHTGFCSVVRGGCSFFTQERIGKNATRNRDNKAWTGSLLPQFNARIQLYNH
jgi:hypothetical protein